jgi:hypothetical protein
MKPIELALQSVEGYLLSIARNPVDGWYEIEVGLPSNWVYDQNNEINCEVLDKTEAGSLIKISPKNTDIEIDDLIAFVEIIIDTNKKIAEKEKQFTDKMQEMKGVLETEAKKFYQELDELRANSFKNNNNDFVKNLRPEGEKEKRHRRTKAEIDAEKLQMLLQLQP